MIIYGINSTLSAIENNVILKLYATEEVASKHLKKYRHEVVTKKQLEKITKTEQHQGIAAEIKANFIKDKAHFEKLMKEDRLGNVLLLDHIEDQHNLGAIIRSAEIFGFKNIIISKDRAASITSTTIKTSAGAIFNTNIFTLKNIVNVLKELKEHNYWVVGGLLSDDSMDLNKIKFDFKSVLVIGNENNGISKTIEKQLDFKAIIPMIGETQSLNASVSAGIMMYQISTSNKS